MLALISVVLYSLKIQSLTQLSLLVSALENAWLATTQIEISNLTSLKNQRTEFEVITRVGWEGKKPQRIRESEHQILY